MVGKNIIKISIIFVILIIFMFNIAIVKNYNSFAILKLESMESLTPELEKVIIATKVCNELKNSEEELCVYIPSDKSERSLACLTVKDYCYNGISYKLGYMTQKTSLCNKLKNTRGKLIRLISFCYGGIGNRIGRGNDTKKFEDHLQICETEGGDYCIYVFFQGETDFEYCEKVDEKYKSYCYSGVGRNLLPTYELKEAIKKCQNSIDYTTNCIIGLSYSAGRLKIPITNSLKKWAYYSGLGFSLGQENSEIAFKLCEEIKEIKYEQSCKAGVAHSIGFKSFEEVR